MAEDGYEALRTACALVERPHRALVEMTGEDRARFLNGLVTCDVPALAPGEGTYGFLTSVKGRVIADIGVMARDDRLWLDLPASEVEAVLEHLRKYVIVDRVEIAAAEPTSVALVGPTAAALLEELAPGVELPGEPWHHRPLELLGQEVFGARLPDVGVPAWALWTTAVEDLADALLAAGVDRGLRRADEEAVERLRVEAGRPLYGRDFGADNFPQETGLEEEAVSYTKGCYLGQEVVARIHYRGGVNRHLRGLVVESDAPASDLVGRQVLHDGRAAGIVTSAAATGDGRRLALAIVHRRAEPGARVEVEGAGPADLVELPLDRD